MSTKTTFKRVALVAVAALGMGVLSSVAPASAVPTVANPSTITVANVTGARAGVMQIIPVTFNLPTGFAVTDTLNIVARVITSPAATSFSTAKAATPGVAAVLSTAASGGATTAGSMFWAKPATGSGSYSTGLADSTATAASTISSQLVNTGSNSVFTGVADWTRGAVATTATGDSVSSVTYNLHFTPDGSGTYSIAVAAGSLLAAYDDNSDLMALTNAQIFANLVNTTFTVATSGSPTTVALAAVSAAPAV
jgi:hypothetical protein